MKKDHVKQIVSQLTLAEKARLLGGKNVWETVDIPRLSIPSLFLADGPHGVRKQAGAGDHLGLNASLPATCFPTMATLACSFDTQLVQQVGAALGKEAASLGVHLLLGPGLNIKRHPFCGRNFEYVSEDSYLSGKMAAAYVRGIQSAGTGACVKHFAANSQELGRMVTDSVPDERTLRELYLTGFEIAVREGKPQAVMSSYNRLGGVYANENPWLLMDVLRREWGFDGIVVSDWGGSNDHVRAVEAGSNLEMPGAGLASAIEIVEAVESGRLSARAVDARVEELLAFILSHTDADGAAKKDRELTGKQIKENRRIAARAAKESIVLLKNEGDILPLSKKEKVALIGEFALESRFQGGGSSAVHARHPESLALLAGQYMERVIVCRGFSMKERADAPRQKALREEALAAAREADVVIYCFGLDDGSESEGVDRTTYALPDIQTALLADICRVNSRVIGVLTGGSAVDLSVESHLQGLLHGYLGGEAGAEAMWDVLTGAYNPSGHLAETYPLHVESIPCHSSYPETGERIDYGEKMQVGYRYFCARPELVRFPFGFGLSYTSFAYADLQIFDDHLEFTVENTGQRAGACVPQLYVEKLASAYHRTAPELKGFAKVYLEPGEQKMIRMDFDRYTFRIFNADAHRWIVEEGAYTLRIGAYAGDERLAGQVLLDRYEDAAVSSFRPQTDPLEVLASRREGLVHMNSPLIALKDARHPLARLAGRVLSARLRRMKRKKKADLNLLFQCYMPIRALAKMTGGRISMDMARALTAVINGVPGGLRALFTAWRKKRRAEREYK